MGTFKRFGYGLLQLLRPRPTSESATSYSASVQAGSVAAALLLLQFQHPLESLWCSVLINRSCYAFRYFQ